jgi:hypothetical protein
MTQQLPVTQPVEERTLPGCRHHWVIQPATGPVSPGVCQNCGEAREFKNYVEASTWGDERGGGRPRHEVARTVADQLEDEEE